MAVPSPFQRTAADGEGVWASGMSHTHNEPACCAIQYKKGKHKQQSRLGFMETVNTSSQETNWSSTGVCSTGHNNALSQLMEAVAQIPKVKACAGAKRSSRMPTDAQCSSMLVG